MQILDGKSLSGKLKDDILASSASYKRVPILAVITIGDDSSSEVYVRNKKKACEYVGFSFMHFSYSKDTKENINTETSKATTSILEKQMKEVLIEPPKNILIIDSNVYSAKILTEILSQFNVTVTSAKTGEEAIISVIDKTFDLILLDDSLEDIKVPKIMSDLTSIAGFNSPVVLMSKQTEEEVKQVITKNNLSGYISKPINNIEVENMYASIIKKD